MSLSLEDKIILIENQLNTALRALEELRKEVKTPARSEWEYKKIFSRILEHDCGVDLSVKCGEGMEGYDSLMCIAVENRAFLPGVRRSVSTFVFLYFDSATAHSLFYKFHYKDLVAFVDDPKVQNVYASCY